MNLRQVAVTKVNTARKVKKDKDGEIESIWTETTITLSVLDADDATIGQLARFTGKEAVSVEFGNQLGMAGMMRD